MRKLKRAAAMLLAAIMLVGLVPLQASAASSTKLIALTFDDGPSAANTTRLLDGLKARGVHATFFMVGEMVKNNPAIVKRAWQEGHQICNHTYSHAILTSISDSAIKSEISKTDSALDKAIGYDLNYSLRPPGGGYSDRVLKAVGVPCYYWSVDTRDWESRNATSAYNQFIKAARNGSIVLMHDLYGTSVTAALNAIDTLKAQGYEFVTLNELMVRRGITPTAGKIYYDAYPDSAGTGDKLSKPSISYQDTSSGKKVVITGDSRAKIYYTTDGSEPMPNNSKKYTGSFSVSDNTTVKARCVFDWNGFKTDSVSKTVKYTTLSTPKISVSGGKISLSGLPTGASYYYTTNDTAPTTSSNKYSSSFTAKADTVYTVKGYATGYYSSGTTWITYSARGHVYDDVKPYCWYYKAADRAVSEGLLSISNRKLSAENEVTRAQLVTMLYNMAGKPDTEGLTYDFTDVPDDCSYLKALLWAYDTGITNGCGEGRFMPDAKVTREQMCAMLARYAAACGMDLSGVADDALEDFTDKDYIEPCIYDSVNAMCAIGIIKGYGDGTMLPKCSVTRAEAATMLVRLEDALAA